MFSSKRPVPLTHFSNHCITDGTEKISSGSFVSSGLCFEQVLHPAFVLCALKRKCSCKTLPPLPDGHWHGSVAAVLRNQLLRFQAASGISHLREQPQRNYCLQEVSLAPGTADRSSVLNKLVCTKCLPAPVEDKRGYSFPDGPIQRRMRKPANVQYSVR